MKTPVLSVLVGLSLCSIGGAMIYVYLKNKYDEADEEKILEPKAKMKKMCTVEMLITNEMAPLVVGRNSYNLYSIEERTGTSIKFREKDGNYQICEIHGEQESVKSAQELIKQTIKKADSVTIEIDVPSTASGKIMGRCGDSLQEICRKSKAKVSVLSGERHAPTRRVIIVGNQMQVNTAKLLIDEKVKEDSDARKLLTEVELKREPRGGIRTPTTLTPASSRESLPPKPEKLIPTSSDGQLEVYVSAVASPARFWLQLVGPQSSELDILVNTMTEYYTKVNNQELHKIKEPYLGQIVAAMFKFDSKWYRAEVISILPNDYRPGEVVLDLYFVDYGDSEYVGTHEVCELRTDFLRLRFQAIECYLAHVRPSLTNEPDIWDEPTICRFAELTHVAQWKKMLSRIVTYKERTKGDTRIRREGSPVPGIELYDFSEGHDINVANELIAEGFAIMEIESSELTNNQITLIDDTNISTSICSNNSNNSNSSTDTSQSTSFHEILTNQNTTQQQDHSNLMNFFDTNQNNLNKNINNKLLRTNDKFSAIVENTTNENYENIQKDNTTTTTIIPALITATTPITTIQQSPYKNSSNLLLNSERNQNGNSNKRLSDKKSLTKDWNEIIEEEMREGKT